VAVYSLDLNDRLVADCRALGVQAFISKALGAEDFCRAVLDWPGRDAGLTSRQSEAYAKLGVANRVAAAAWAHRSGAFSPLHGHKPPVDDPREAGDAKGTDADGRKPGD
jgi:hypothetical protein